MSLYCIGDVQGCDAALGRLLDALGFSPSRDTIFVLGDLVNRGPDSRGVLHRLIGYGASARCLLGNHDLHLLAVAHGARKRRRSETIADILDAPDREPLLDWLRQQDMAFFEQGVLMVHAGVLPGWTTAQTLALAGEVEAVLRGPDIAGFLHKMYGDEPAEWDDGLQRQGAPARDRQRADAPAFLHGRRRHGVRNQGGRGRHAAGFHALV